MGQNLRTEQIAVMLFSLLKKDAEHGGFKIVCPTRFGGARKTTVIDFQFLDSPEYEEAMMPFYRRHVCRLDPWPDFVVRTFDRMATPIYHYMAGPSEFRIIGTLRDWDIMDRLGEIAVPTLILVGDLDRPGPDPDVDPKAAKLRHELSIEPRDGLGHQRDRERAAVSVGDVQPVIEEVEVDLELPMPVRYRGGGQTS